MNFLSLVINVFFIKIVFSIKIDCDFIKTDIGYECYNTNLRALKKGERIGSVSGKHVGNYTNEDVVNLIINQVQVSYIPRNLAFFFPSIIYFYINSNELEEIKKEDIEQFKLLQRLHVESLKIRKLDADFFHNNIKIENFGIKGDTLFTSIHPQLITSNMTSLEVIKIQNAFGFQQWNTNYSLNIFWDCVVPSYPYNDILYCVYQTKNDEKSFYSCVVVEHTIQGNKQNRYPNGKWEIFGIHKNNKTNGEVLEFELKWSNSTTFPTTLGKTFKNLKIVRIKAKIISLFVDKMQEISNLEELYLSHNNIKAILSNTFMNNKKLRIIDLEGNPIKNIGVAVFWYPQYLTHLTICSYFCMQFQAQTRKEIENFVDEQINLNCTDHDALLCEFRLQTLSFVGNVYTCLGNNTDLKDLKYGIDLRDVSFGHHIKGFTNHNVKALKIKNYEMVPIFNFKLYENFPHLKYIKIFNSKIEQLTTSIFNRLQDLLVIDLSFNAIKILTNSLFKNNHKLIYINFKGNLLTTIPPKLFTNNLHLEFANFENNSCIDINAIGKSEIEDLLNVVKQKCSKPN